MYQLTDGLQRKRFPVSAMKAKGVEIIERVRDGAALQRWQVVCNDKNVSVGGVVAPSTKKLIAATLIDGTGPTPAQLGAALWALLSGIAHGVRYALAFNMEAAPRTSELEPLLVGMATSSGTVHLIGAAIARGAMTVCNTRVDLMGWDRDADWGAAVDHAEAHIGAVLAATAPTIHDSAHRADRPEVRVFSAA